MSIHQLAHHLQSAGRGDDKVLVHMTPQEVNGLQALAMAHGGSLTINPKTGLPEAGFLSAILPMVAGFFLGPAGLQLTAMQSALTVGALGTAATGSLGKGLMMGLGAYGGAGLGQSLIGAGETALANAAPTVAEGTAGAGASTTAEIGAGSGMQNAKLAMEKGLVEAPVSNTGAYTSANLSQTPIVNAGQYPAGAYGVAPPSVTPPAATEVALEAPKAATSYPYTSEAARAANDPLMEAQANARATAGTPSNWDKVKAGFDDTTSSGTKAWEFIKKNPTPFISAGLGLLSEFSNTGSGASSGVKKQPGTIRPYEYSVKQDPNAYLPTASTAERTYFVEPRFIAGTPYTAKEGGLMSLAVGGAVEEMSARNSISDNTSYPQAQMQTDIYSNPMVQRPMPTNVISAGLDTPTNAYTGEAKFASGGAAATKTQPSTDTKYSYDPATMQYTQTTTTTPTNTFGGNGLIAMPGISPIGMGMGFGGQYMGGGLPKNALTMGTGGGYLGGGFPRNALTMGINPALLGNQQAPQPTVTTQTSGGIAAPYVPPEQQQLDAAQTPAPAINIPQYQTPEQQLGLEGFYNMMGDQLAMKGAQLQSQRQGFAVGGGISDLGDYSDGGRLLKGPGDGVSDSIPASIGDRQPARLADGEFVVPARIVSEIGNGSTEAGAKKLYAMMDRVQKARKKTVGKNQVAKNTKAEKLLPV